MKRYQINNKHASKVMVIEIECHDMFRDYETDLVHFVDDTGMVVWSMPLRSCQIEEVEK